MRDIGNIGLPSEAINTNNIITIDNLPEYQIPEYDTMDEKELNRLFDHVELVVRSSMEYRKFIQYLKDYMDMNKCSFYKNVNNIDTTKVKIHIHHEPFTLGDIVRIIYNKREKMHEDLEEEMIAKEVMYIHYCLCVGLIPLAETVHELVHNKYLFVPTTKVLGKYKEFAYAYEEYIDPTIKDKLNRIEEASIEPNYDYETLLDRNFIYLDITGAYSLPTYTEVQIMMKNRINTLMDKSEQRLIIPGYFEDRH